MEPRTLQYWKLKMKIELPIPFTALSGFTDTGKTTLLELILKKEWSRKFAAG